MKHGALIIAPGYATLLAMNDYSSFASVYDLFYADFAGDIDMYAGFAERTGGPILEIGSGTGRVAIALAEVGHTMVGLELSDAMRSIAQSKIDRAQLAERVTLIAGDMRRFKIDQYFGLAIAPINTFLHNLTLDDQLATLNCIKKQLRPGGLLVLDCFNTDPSEAADDHRLILQHAAIDPSTGQTALLLMARLTDWANQLQEITYVADRPDEHGCIQRTVFPTKFRFIFRHEMHALLKLAGFDLKDVYGSYELGPFEAASDKMIVVASPA
jgi:ubiquinone/menaquinone biosynthesis C-methylase UbiE